MTAGPLSSAHDLPLKALQPVLLRRARALCARSFHNGGWSPEDLVQETLARICAPNVQERLSALDLDTVRPYAMRVLAHLFIDEVVRKKSPTPAEDIVHLSDKTGDASVRQAETALVEREAVELERQRAAAAAATLTDQERAFLALSFEKNSAAAAQKQLGWPPGKSSNAAMKRARLIRRIQCALNTPSHAEETTGAH